MDEQLPFDGMPSRPDPAAKLEWTRDAVAAGGLQVAARGGHPVDKAPYHHGIDGDRVEGDRCADEEHDDSGGVEDDESQIPPTAEVLLALGQIAARNAASKAKEGGPHKAALLALRQYRTTAPPHDYMRR